MYGENVLSRKVIVFWTMGNSCQDFAQYGGQDGVAGQHMTDYNSVVCQVLANKPDLVLLENNKNFPASLLNTDLGDMYHVVRFESKPSVGGFPAHRGRAYFALALKIKWSFTGSNEEFLRIFSEAPMLDADDLLCASDDERTKLHLKLAADQGNVYDGNTPIEKVAIHHCMPASQRRTYDKHKETQATGCNIKGTYVADLEQNFGWSSSGPCGPCLVTHGKIVSISKGKVFTAKEHLAMMGEAVYPDLVGQGGECLFQHVLDNNELSDAVIKRIAGQGMHLHYLTPLMVYALACLKVSTESVSCE
jgi:hypothetical protein